MRINSGEYSPGSDSDCRINKSVDRNKVMARISFAFIYERKINLPTH